jgi:fatty acid-binding protein DegV
MLAELAAASIEHPAERPVIVSHGDCADDAATLERLLKEKCGPLNILRTRIGVIIGTHTGGGVLCVYLWGNSRASTSR